MEYMHNEQLGGWAFRVANIRKLNVAESGSPGSQEIGIQTEQYLFKTTTKH